MTNKFRKVILFTKSGEDMPRAIDTNFTTYKRSNLYAIVSIKFLGYFWNSGSFLHWDRHPISTKPKASMQHCVQRISKEILTQAESSLLLTGRVSYKFSQSQFMFSGKLRNFPLLLHAHKVEVCLHYAQNKLLFFPI